MGARRGSKMFEFINSPELTLAAITLSGIWGSVKPILLIFAGFSLVVFMHELGHFVMAKLADVRVEKFAIGFGREIAGFTRGETRYSFNILPLGGYVKMLGQEDFAVDKSGEIRVKDDPRSFSNKPVGWRMAIVSAGVIMNVVFAAILFTVVFMIGFEFLSPSIGTPLPGTPAEAAGLEFGDRILEINGKSINDYTDIQMAIVLAEPHIPLKMKIRRGEQVIEKDVLPENNPDKNLQQIGVPPKSLRVIKYVPPEPGEPRNDAPKEGDEVISINGKPVHDYIDINYNIMAACGKPVTMEVDRPDPTVPGKKDRITVTRRASMLKFAPTSNDVSGLGNLLGFVPRIRVAGVAPKGPADQAGIKEGDIIAEWTNINAPTPPEIISSVENNAGVPLNVGLIRDGKRVEATVRPAATGILRRGKPQVGIDYSGQEEESLVIADIVDENDGRATPAAALHKDMRRGSVITKVNDIPVKTWNDLVALFMELAGSEVKLSWRYGEEPEQTQPFTIPATINTLAKMPFMARIFDIDGATNIETVKKDGKLATWSVRNWKGVYEILKKKHAESPDKEITVRFRDILDRNGPIQEAKIKLDANMLDPWTMRVVYAESLLTEEERILVKTSNPAEALWIGLNKTYDFILQAYLTMKRMIFTRTVGVENISGPVGIFHVGMAVAESGLPQLMFFLAFLSVNLAVINFLPMPIVDGGLMVFLLIEKIRGTPVSIKTQVVTQVIGLAIIIAAFVFVTFMDISKL